jgi:GntR family transcriptional regulator
LDVTTQQALARVAARLDSDSTIPLYEQIAKGLRDAIESGALEPGSALPSEPEIAASFGVSRQTVNVALTKLAQRGLLTRKRGTGTFVAQPFVEQPLGGLYSFIHTLESQGRLPGARLLGFRLVVDDRASPLLAEDDASLVHEIKRLRLVDGEPFAVETTYLPMACGQSLPMDRLETTPLYDLLETYCGLTVTHADETLRPVTLDRTDASLLAVRPGEPAFLVERIGYAGERPVELRLSIIRGDRYRFTVALQQGDQTLT